MGNNQSSFADRALKKLAKNENVELLVVPSLETKEDKPSKEEPKKYANEYEEYIKTWQPGDFLPIIPPGGKFTFCRFHPGEIHGGEGVFTVHGKSQSKMEQKELYLSQEIEYKVLGKKLKDSIDSLLARAARTRGLWVDDKNKLRCPPGSPAANQFTDMGGSNCLIPSPKNAVQSGARAVRRLGRAAAQASAVGERMPESFDAARATQEQIRELGFEKVQELMAIGGRIIAPADQANISGSMRAFGTALTNAGARKPGIASQPKRVGKGRSTRDTKTKAYRLGLKEQIYRGKRATELADSLNRRILNPLDPDGLRLPSGNEIGDLRDKTNFVNAMREVFPHVDPAEFGQLFDNFIPAEFSYIQRLKLKEAYVPFFQTLIANAIANPGHAAWITQMNIQTDRSAPDQSAFRVDLVPYNPGLTAGGRTASIGAQKFNQKIGASYENGGVHFAMNLNPYSMYEQATGASPFNKDGRSSGIRDTMQGDMHYVATHEFGHIAHFGGVMNALGFDTANLSRYPEVRQLTRDPAGGAAERQPERGVGAWIIDFRQARNPMGSPSIQAVIDAATRLQNRNYAGYARYNRAEVERDLKNFHWGLSEAIENNITDNEAERLLMLQFAGGEYATENSLELRAEYYAARRMFGDEISPKRRRFGIPSIVPGVNSVIKFADAMATVQNSQYTSRQIMDTLDDAGQRIYGIHPVNWNISGRMGGSTPAPSLKTRAIRNSVNQNNGQRRQRQPTSGRISGSMGGPGIGPRLTPSRVFKEQDTLNEEDFKFTDTVGERESLTTLSPLIQSLNIRSPQRPAIQMGLPNLQKISGSMKVFKDTNHDSLGTAKHYLGTKTDRNIKGTTYVIDGQKTAFDSPWIKYDDQSVKVIKRNPFEITGLDEKSDKGRELSEKWIYAHVAPNDGEKRREETEVDALLYAGVRGDKEAMDEFERLSEIGRSEVSARAEKNQKGKLERIEKYSNQRMREENVGDFNVEDLFLVHETSYAPQIDENGDIDLRPLADFDQIADNGEAVRVPRHTVHFALNHLAEGHVFRQRSETDTDIIVIPLSEMIKDNPDAIEMLYSVDTSFTPKPGEGLKLKSGKYRVIKGTPDETDTRARVEETLKELGATRIIKAQSAESSSAGIDAAIYKLSEQLNVNSGLDSNGPNAEILRYISNQRTIDMSAHPSGIGSEMLSKMSRNARMRLGVSDYWQSSDEVENSWGISGRMSDGIDPGFYLPEPPGFENIDPGFYRRARDIDPGFGWGDPPGSENIDPGFGWGDPPGSQNIDPGFDWGVRDMVYRRPLPGTPEWERAKKRGDAIRASGDPRWRFDENGFAGSFNMLYIREYDDPMSPYYIGDQHGGPPKGTPVNRPTLYSSQTPKDNVPYVMQNLTPKKRISGRMGTADNDNLDSSIRKIVNGLKLDDNAQNTLSKIVDDWTGSKNEFQPSGGRVSGLESDFLGAEAEQEASMQRTEAIRARLVKDIKLITKDPEKQKVLWNSLMELGANINQQISGNIKKREARITGAMSDGSVPEKAAKSLIRKNKDGIPQHPRKPTYGPMLGKTNEAFDGVSTWEEFKEKYNDLEIVFLDYETTGLIFDEFNRSSGNGAPVQIGAVKVNGGQVTDRFNVFVNPNMRKSEWEQWSRDTLKGPDGESLTDEFFADKPSIAEAHEMLAQFAGPNALMGVQNAAFDKDVLEDALRQSGIEWSPSGWIDLKDMASMTLPKYSEENPDGPHKFDKKQGKNVPSNSLKEITKYLGVDLGDKHHNADADAEATAESMKQLIDGAIEKNWSRDVLTEARRRQYVREKERRYNEEVVGFDKQLAEYKQISISGKMASDPKNAMILSRVNKTEMGSSFGFNQSREYYKSVPRRFGWKQETLESSEPERINNRKRIISDLTEFLQNGDNNGRSSDSDDHMNDMMYWKPLPGTPEWRKKKLEGDIARASGDPRYRFDENGFVTWKTMEAIPEFDNHLGDVTLFGMTNGLDPQFFDYIKNTDKLNLLSDLRQASIEFHSGVDVRPVISITPSQINNILESGLKFNENATPLTKIYHADIGIHPDTPDELRPVVAQMIHTDTTKAEDSELASIFSKFEESEILSGRRDFKFLDRGLARKNRDSSFDYEEAEVKLRSSVTERTSYGNGSAVHNHIFPVSLLSDDPDAIGRALIDSVGRGDKRDENIIELLYGKFKGDFDAYRTDNGKTRSGAAGRWQERDALILGGINPEDIEEISIPFNKIDMTNAETPSATINRLNNESGLGFTSNELQILTNIGSGIDAERAIPKNIAVRINNLGQYDSLSKKLDNLAKVDVANNLKIKADAMGIDLVFTNRFGLNIFNGVAFDSQAASSSDSREVLRKKTEKIMKEIVSEMRKVKAELGDTNNVASKISGAR